MSSAHQNLSTQLVVSGIDFSDVKLAIVLSEWNSSITLAMAEGAREVFERHRIPKENILTYQVPGSFELTLGCQWIATHAEVDAILAIGCVIQGETPHFEYICQSVTYGLTELNIKYNLPIVFGVLTTLTMEQARDRAGGKHGNKGHEAALTALKMLVLRKQMR